MRSLRKRTVSNSTEQRLIRAHLVLAIDCFLAEERRLREHLIRAIDCFLALDFRLRDWTKLARLLHSAGDVAELLLRHHRWEWAKVARILHGAGDMAEILSHRDGPARYHRKLEKRARKQ